MNKFRKNKLYCAIWMAMNLVGAGRVEAVVVGPSANGIANTNLTLDGTIKGFNSNLGAGLQTQPQQTFSGANPTIDAKSYGVFSNNSVFFSFSNFVIDRNSIATFSCSSGFCAGTSNVISRVNSPTNQAEIYGTLTSTISNQSGVGAAFYLLSPNGVVIGKNATIDVPGALHIGTTNTLTFGDGSTFGAATTDVSTLNATPQAFGFLAAGTITLGADDGSGTSNSTIHITSVGPAELSAGNVVAVDPGVGNTDTLNANTAGNTLAIEAGGADAGSSAITISNRNTVSETSGGNISMEANEGSITQAGTVNASSSVGSGGDITLTAATGIANTGTLDASGYTAGGNVTLALTPANTSLPPGGGAGGEGTATNNSAPGPLVYQGGTIHADSSSGVGGQVVLSGEYLQLDSGSLTTATGAAGGGAIYAGGGPHGAQIPLGLGLDLNVTNATYTRVEAGATLDASATNNGNGGTIVAWGDSASRAYGTFNAKGGPNGGNGGTVETSGHWLDVTGIKVDASAVQGKVGEWLLDPYDVTIVDGTAGGKDQNGDITGTTWTPKASPSTVTNTSINGALDNNDLNVIIKTTNTNGGDNGDITVSAPILHIASTGNGATPTLTLSADGGIFVNSSISGSSSVGGTFALNITLQSGLTPASTAPITIGSSGSLSSYGGNISLTTNGAGNSINLSGNVNSGAGTVTLNSASGINQTLGFMSATTLSGSAGGNVSLTNNNVIANLDKFTTNSGSFTLKNTNAGGLSVTSTVSSSGPALISTTGALLLGANDISGNGVTLTSAGVSSTGGTVNGGSGTLTVDGSDGITTGAINLGGALATSNTTASAVTVKDGTTVTLAGISTGAGGGVTVQNANSAALDGAINSGTLTLGNSATDLASGVTQTGTITTGTLTGQTGGAVNLGLANVLTNLGTFSSKGGLTVADSTLGLSVTGTVTDSSGAVSISTAGGALALGTNNVSGVGVSLKGDGVTSSSGTVDGGSGTITVDGSDGTTTGAIALGGALATSNASATAVTVKDGTTVTLAGISTGAGGGVTVQNANSAALNGTINTGTAGTVTLGTSATDLASGVTQTGIITTDRKSVV